MAGTLYLIPTPLAHNGENRVIPEFNLNIIRRLRYYVVEHIPKARSFLAFIKSTVPEFELNLEQLDKSSEDQRLLELINPLLEGYDMGLISDVGCPAIADPGAKLVALAHLYQIKVKPLSGPSSFFMALMASGLQGQRFRFLGYLPKKDSECMAILKQIEDDSSRNNETQLFMESPHRNNTTLKLSIQNLKNNTMLSISSALTANEEWIATKSIGEWKSKPLPDLNNQPAVFSLLAASGMINITRTSRKAKQVKRW